MMERFAGVTRAWRRFENSSAWLPWKARISNYRVSRTTVCQPTTSIGISSFDIPGSPANNAGTPCHRLPILRTGAGHRHRLSELAGIPWSTWRSWNHSRRHTPGSRRASWRACRGGSPIRPDQCSMLRVARSRALRLRSAPHRLRRHDWFVAMFESACPGIPLLLMGSGGSAVQRARGEREPAPRRLGTLHAVDDLFLRGAEPRPSAL